MALYNEDIFWCYFIIEIYCIEKRMEMSMELSSIHVMMVNKYASNGYINGNTYIYIYGNNNYI